MALASFCKDTAIFKNFSFILGLVKRFVVFDAKSFGHGFRVDSFIWRLRMFI